MKVTKLQIKNFLSHKSSQVELSDLGVVVGCYCA